MFLRNSKYFIICLLAVFLFSNLAYGFCLAQTYCHKQNDCPLISDHEMAKTNNILFLNTFDFSLLANLKEIHSVFFFFNAPLVASTNLLFDTRGPDPNHPIHAPPLT